MFDLTSNHLRIAVHGGGDSGGGMAGALESFLSFIESLLELSPTQLFERVLPGVSSLDNLHPLFVHFPIALLSLFFVLDVAGTVGSKAQWRRSAASLLYAGALFAAPTVVMGLVAAAAVAHGGDVHEIMERHEQLGISVFLLASVLALWRFWAKAPLSGAANILYLILATLLMGLLVFAADLGGLMVFKYGVAVEPVTAMNREAASLHQHGLDGMHEESDLQDHDALPYQHDHDH
ncbi:MAG: DUF2231 domain-containing protein [Methylomonas sp.]|nr:DUF2231 domain-containing protein [Methylomonas sp.]